MPSNSEVFCHLLDKAASSGGLFSSEPITFFVFSITFHVLCSLLIAVTSILQHLGSFGCHLILRQLPSQRNTSKLTTISYFIGLLRHLFCQGQLPKGPQITMALTVSKIFVFISVNHHSIVFCQTNQTACCLHQLEVLTAESI